MELVQLIEWHFILRTAFFGSSPTRSLEKELEIRGPWKRGFFQCRISISLYQALGQCEQTKNASEQS